MPSPTTPADAPFPAPSAGRLRRRAKRRRLAIATIAAAAVGAWPLTWSLAATAPTQTAPGSLTGWAFDACSAPSASTMDAWLKDPTDPYRGIGIYISGSLRACSQSNLTANWVSHVQQTGWHLLPLTVGPQASCTGFSQVVNAAPANTYAAARRQGAAQADDAVSNARALGINPGSTLFYDMENWHTGYNNCDASTLWFMSAWSNRLHAYGYAGGVYVSALSGARLMNAMANNKPSGFVLPDQIWTAEWNNQENVNSAYLSAGNWANHQRAHQYYGGHNATNSHITLNIDSNYVDLRPVWPIPAVVPDSAIGAPIPTPSPVPSLLPSSLPTLLHSILPTPTKTPTKTATKTPTTAPTKTPTTTKPTTKPTQHTTSPTPVRTTVSPKPKPTSTPTAKAPTTKVPAPKKKVTTPAKKPTKVAPTKVTPSKTPSLTGTINNLTGELGSATGIKLPVLPAARQLDAKQALRVPVMEAPAAAQHTQVTTTAKPQAKQASASPTPTASASASAPAPQAAPLQPQLPAPIPATVNEPSLVAQVWAHTQTALIAIGHALAAAAGWVSRALGSMLGW